MKKIIQIFILGVTMIIVAINIAKVVYWFQTGKWVGYNYLYLMLFVPFLFCLGAIVGYVLRNDEIDITKTAQDN